MIDALPIVGAGFIGIATVGFLLIQHYLENSITQHRVDNNKLVAKQKEILDWIEKSQTDRRQAGLSKQNLFIMKVLNVSPTEYEETRKSYQAKIASSYTNSVNALIAAEKLEDNEREILFEEAESFSEKQFTESFLEKSKEAISATATFQNKINSNSRLLLKLEGRKSLFWTVCFGFQSTGIICGLVFMFISAN